MAVNSLLSRVSYVGNGATVNFAVSFPFLATSDLLVIETTLATGVQTTRVLTTDFTVTGTQASDGSFPNGGTVVANVAPPSTVSWTIIRDPVATQLVVHVDGDSSPASSIDGPLDRLTMLVQRVKDLITRSLRQPDGDAAGISTIPPKATRANSGSGSYMGFDANGDATVYVPGPAQASVSVAMSPVITAATLSAGRTALGLGSAAVEAIGDGQTPPLELAARLAAQASPTVAPDGAARAATPPWATAASQLWRRVARQQDLAQAARAAAALLAARPARAPTASSLWSGEP